MLLQYSRCTRSITKVCGIIRMRLYDGFYDYHYNFIIFRFSSYSVYVHVVRSSSIPFTVIAFEFFFFNIIYEGTLLIIIITN